MIVTVIRRRRRRGGSTPPPSGEVTVRQAVNIPYTSAAANPIVVPFALVNPNAGTGRALFVAIAGDLVTSAKYNGVVMPSLVAAGSPNMRLVYMGDADLPTDTNQHNLELFYGGTRTNQDIFIVEVEGMLQPANPAADLRKAANSAANVSPHTISITPSVNNSKIVLVYARIENRTMNSEPSGDQLMTPEDAGVINDAKRITLVTAPTAETPTNFTWTPSGISTFRAAAFELLSA